MNTKVLKLVLLVTMLTSFSFLGIAQNSTPTTPKEKRAAMLTPQYYTNWIGASFLTIPTVESEFEVRPVRIIDLTFFYDFGDCFVGMKSNEEGVVVQMTVRLFSDQAIDFIQKAIDYGYVLVGKGTDINVRSNARDIITDVYESNVKRFRKSTDHGNMYMEVGTSSRSAHEYEIAIFRAK